MLRKLMTTSISLFKPCIPHRTPCYGGPTAEMEAESARKSALEAKKIHEQEILLCKLGSFAYSLNNDMLKLFNSQQHELFNDLRTFHKTHRLDEHNHLKKLIEERVQELKKEIDHQEKYERGSVRDVLPIKYEEYFKLEEELSKLKSVDTKSNEFMVARDKEEIVFNKLKL